MKWFGRIALALVAVIGLLLAIGMLLPSGFKVQRSVEMAATPDRIYPLIADPREWKRWSVWNRRDPSMTMQYSGPPSGSGARWAWKSASEGNGEMEFTAAMANERIDCPAASVRQRSSNDLPVKVKAYGPTSCAADAVPAAIDSRRAKALRLTFPPDS